MSDVGAASPGYSQGLEVTGQLALRLRCQLRQYLERRGTRGNKKRLHETFYSDAAHDAAVTGQRGTGLT